ncbi:MAG TPA: sorbosone dehydrogenase family protein [Bacteroidota bacterium]|nr:sorbosone dehydrogenase family protein [Bacteroidota bacterium]
MAITACAQPTGERAAPGGGLPIDRISLPPGFSIAVYADNVPGARSMTPGPDGLLFVGTRGTGRVYALADRDGDMKAESTTVIASGLNMPNGVAWRGEALYVAEVNRVLRYDGIAGRPGDPPAPVVVNDGFPSEASHGWKYLAFGPDGKLYVPVGAPCNVCVRTDTRYGTIMRMNPDGSGLEVYASGVRNSVGFDWHPVTGELWFTDNGRDMLGDDIPPDELNRAPRPGLNFGFPYCHGGDIPDPEYGGTHDCSEFVPPAAKLGPHVAALGMKFYTGGMFPASYRNTIFIAEHGSWNRSEPIGYRITTVTVPDSGAPSYRTFADGWMRDGHPWGRPVDVLVLPDGSLLISDDLAGAIYRISYASSTHGKP